MTAGAAHFRLPTQSTPPEATQAGVCAPLGPCIRRCPRHPRLPARFKTLRSAIKRWRRSGHRGIHLIRPSRPLCTPAALRCLSTCPHTRLFRQRLRIRFRTRPTHGAMLLWPHHIPRRNQLRGVRCPWRHRTLQASQTLLISATVKVSVSTRCNLPPRAAVAGIAHTPLVINSTESVTISIGASGLKWLDFPSPKYARSPTSRESGTTIASRRAWQWVATQ